MKASVLSAAGLAALLALAGCLETMPHPDRPRPPRPRPEKPMACTREYAPVCATRGRERQTFSNACMARAEKFRVISQRPCGGRDGQ